MTATFVVPEEPSAAEAVAAIGEELAVFDDWMDRYQFIIELGRKLPPYPEEWADDAHRIAGCHWWRCCCASTRGARRRRFLRPIRCS
jgi:cysteine desulfuration protein SufE